MSKKRVNKLKVTRVNLSKDSEQAIDESRGGVALTDVIFAWDVNGEPVMITKEKDPWTDDETLTFIEWMCDMLAVIGSLSNGQ